MSRSADAVDVHAHFFPESFLKVIADHGAVFGASIDRRLKAMNRQGVGVHALSFAVPGTARRLLRL